MRIVVVTPSRDLHDLLGQAVSAAAVPVEIAEASGAPSAARCLADDADLVLIDGALASEETAQITAAAQTKKPPPFTVMLIKSETVPQVFKTDALAARPTTAEGARYLLDRAVRVRLRSRVLVVDDSSTMRTIVRKTLAATRFPLDITEADEGTSALRLARESPFDIVFLDYNMPGLSGLETLSEFKREKQRVSVVLMTSTPDEALAERAQAQGAVFLKKPFFPADIEALLARFYGLRALNARRT